MKKLWPRLWVILLVTLSTAALLADTFGVWPGIPVRNNIMELLPALRDDPVLLQALQRSNQAVSRKLLILVGNPDAQKTAAAAALVEESIRQQDFFAAPMTGMTSAQATAIGQFYYQWRNVLLSEQQHRLLLNNNLPELEKQLTQAVYSPVGGINATLLGNDPLLTFYHFMRSLPPPQGKIQSVNGALQVHSEDRANNGNYRVIIVDIRQDVFDMTLHPRYEAWRNNVQKNLQQQFPQTDLLLMGAIQHAVWGASSAKQEVSTIGNGSLLGIIALVVIVFRSGRALMLSLLPLGTGVLSGLVVTVLCFREVHLITLVFGSTVIGVAMDYSLHYLSEHYKTPASGQASLSYSTLKQVFPGITMAMITSAIAYAAIGFAPFPVLRQIALYSCTGLAVAWLTVVSLYPHMLPPASFRHPRYLQWSGQLDSLLRHLFDRPHSLIALTVFALAMIPGILHIHANDDLRLLQAPEASISAMEKRVQALTGIQTSGRFFLIEGDTQEQLLQREEQLDDWLAAQQPTLSADLLSHYVPSQQRQQENFRLLRNLHDNAAGPSFAEAWREKLGFSADVLTHAAQPFQQTPTAWLTPEEVMASPLHLQLERFQLTATPRGWISAGFVSGTENFSIFNDYAATHSGVHWMDPVADISAMFQHYREQTGWMMLIAYAVIAILLCWRYRPARAWRVMLAPALAAWITLGLLGYAGVAINLFHVLALLLVLGVGIDYSIFFAESHTHRDTTMLAVILSTATTLLSFGLLALSQTAAIRSFGVVVSIGMVCALIFSPLAQYHSVKNSNSEKK